MTVFWDVALAASIIKAITLMMKASGTSETLKNFYQTTQHNIPGDSHLHTCCRENLKSHWLLILFISTLSHWFPVFSYLWTDTTARSLVHLNILIYNTIGNAITAHPKPLPVHSFTLASPSLLLITDLFSFNLHCCNITGRKINAEQSKEQHWYACVL
jgi:hypothetical protein